MEALLMPGKMKTLSKTDTIKPKRESNIELLRIFACIGVIVLHYNNSGIGGAMGVITPEPHQAVVLYFLKVFLSVS